MSSMLSLALWMRIAGGLYIVVGIAAMARVPIRAEGPPEALERAAAGDPTARFLVNTWVTLGLMLVVLGAALVCFAGMAEDARALAWTVVALELCWGIPVDVFKIARGQPKAPSLVWIVIHTLVAVAGLKALGAW